MMKKPLKNGFNCSRMAYGQDKVEPLANKKKMKIQCKNCLPKEGIEIPGFSTTEKEEYRELKEKSPIHAVKKLIAEKNFSHRDAKYLVLHINPEYGQCNRCSFSELEQEYGKCPQCGALNLNWTRTTDET